MHAAATAAVAAVGVVLGEEACKVAGFAAEVDLDEPVNGCR